MNEIDKNKIGASTVLELAELGRQIPQQARRDLIRRVEAVINGAAHTNPILTDN